MEIELNIPETEITGKDISVETGNTNIAVLEDTKDLDITYNRKEYSIIGDGIFISSVLEDVPEWLGNLIDSTFEAAILSRDQNLINRMEAILTAMDYVPKNRYTEQINQIVDEDGIINTRIATLNSNLTDAINTANATIAEIDLTYASKDEAAAISTNVLTASLSADGEIGSTLIELQNVYADLESTTAESIILLESVMEGEINGNASAMQTIRSYVGIDEAGASTGTGLLADVEILQKQNDGVIETYAGTYDVMSGVEDPNIDESNDELITSAEPYATWIASDTVSNTQEERAAHVGDVYIKYSSAAGGYKNYERAYKFIKTTVDGTSPYATDPEGYTWALIVDTDAQNAYVAALNARDLADDKRRVFVPDNVTSTRPVPPYDVGDLWLVQTGNNITGIVAEVGDILRCTETKTTSGVYESNDWVRSNNYREAMNAIQTDLNTWRTGAYSTFVTDITSQVDSKAETFYQASVPVGRVTSINVPNNTTLNKYIGDLWKNTYAGTISGYLGNSTEYVYTKVANGSNWDYKWTVMEVPDIVFDTIDTKKSIYTGNSLPTAVYPDVIELNDMWITGDSPVSPYIAKSIYVWNGTAWRVPVRYTDDQYAKDIENGTRQIDLSQHIDSLGWSNSISALFSDVNTINTDLTQKALEIANLDNIISVEEAARIQAILDEESARIADIALRVAEDARLDGVITAEEQNRINAVNELDYAYKEYGRIIALALADGVLTPEEQLAITTAQTAVNAARQRLLDIENNVSTLFSDITAINTTTASQALEIANLDNAISQEESSRIQAILDEESARIQAINARIAKEALLDGKITAEEQARIDSINDVEVAYKEYSRVVTLAIADGVLTPDEQALITAAAAEVQAAKDRLLEIETNANNYSDSILDNFLVSTYSKDLLNIGNQIDGVAVTYFQDNAPYSVTVGTSANSGDVWYDTNALTPTAYKFVYKVLDSNGTTVISPSVWEPITNTFVLSSLEAASKTKASADRSIKNYTTTPITPYYEGDTWMQGSTGDIYVCDVERLTGAFNLGDWVKASKYTDDTNLDAFVDTVNNTIIPGLQSQIDGQINYYFYDSSLGQTAASVSGSAGWTTDILKKEHHGDIAYNTKLEVGYWYDRVTSAWNQITGAQNAGVIEALKKAAEAKNIADSKITSYYIDTYANVQALSNGWTAQQKLDNTGDIAIVYNDSTLNNNGTWRWNGTNWVNTRDKKLIALASDVTQLSTELTNGTNTWATAYSTLENSLSTEITNESARVEGKFAYNSIIGINGVYKKSGFGLTTNYTSGTGTEADPYVSEFWIDASRFRFTNGTNNTLANGGEVFTIDASGTTPQIKFNGVVEFSNLSNVPSLGSNNMLVNARPTLGNETYGWQIGWYNTNIAPTGPAAGFDPWRPTGGGSVYAVVGGSPAVGTVFDLRQSTNIPVVAGKRYEISALLSSHRCTSVCTLAFFNSSGTYLSEIGAGTANSRMYGGNISNWVRQGGFVTVPAGTAYAQFYVRSTVTGVDPYCFVAQAYMAEASASSTQFSTWGEGVSANSTINWQSEVQAAINNNATYIDGGKIVTNAAFVNNLNALGGIVADSVKSYSLTSTNATIQNALIKNAHIDDLSVSTFKIQNEAVIVPRSVTGVGSTTIYYTPTVTHSIVCMLTGGVSAYNTVYRLYVNGSIWYQSPSGYGSDIAINILGTLQANVTYNITFNATVQSGYTVPTLQLIMLGTKK